MFLSVDTIYIRQPFSVSYLIAGLNELSFTTIILLS